VLDGVEIPLLEGAILGVFQPIQELFVVVAAVFAAKRDHLIRRMSHYIFPTVKNPSPAVQFFYQNSLTIVVVIVCITSHVTSTIEQ